MGVYEHNESVFHGSKAMLDALVDMMNWVERPLRRVTLPEMPPQVRGVVEDGISSAIATMSTTRATTAGIAHAMKRVSYWAVEHDINSDLGWGWKVGDAVIAGSDFLGLNFLHKAVNEGDYSGAALDVGLMLFPWGKAGKAAAKGMAKGGRHALGIVGGRRAGNKAGSAGVSGLDDAIRGANSNLRPNATLPPRWGDRAWDRPTYQPGRGSTHLHSGVGDVVERGSTGRPLHAAQASAASLGGNTIEMSGSGVALDAARLFDMYPYPLARRIWERHSVEFLTRTTGPVRATVGSEVRMGSVLAARELPTMLRNDAIPSFTVRRAGAVRVSRAPVAIKIDRQAPDAVQRMVDAMNEHDLVRFTFQ